MSDPVSIGAVQDSIKVGLASLGATAAGALVWADEARPAAFRYVILNVVTADAIQDREEYAEDPEDPTQLVWTLSTLYYIRVQVRAESIYNDPTRGAWMTLEKIRAGLKRPDLVFTDGVVNQPDDDTYIHHTSYPHDGHMINSYSFETGFRAVVDFSLEGPLPAGSNMVQVETIGTRDREGEVTPETITQVIDRPI